MSALPGPAAGNPLAADLEEVLGRTRGLWEELRGARLFVTGGTGFVGRWLLESFAWANRRLDLGASALVLTRDPAAARRAAPHLGEAAGIGHCPGDVRDFRFPPGAFTHVVHAAAVSALATFNREDPLVKFDTVAGGTRRALEFAAACGARRFLLTGSGAAYGRQPEGMARIPEDHHGIPDPLSEDFALGGGKRAAEFFCACLARAAGFEATVARCFSFLGPHLPLDLHYAAGNFVRDALAGGPVRVQGDGTAVRSYLYAADLAVWLWTILLRGAPGRAYNVGAEEGLSIAELARAVAREAGGLAVTVAGTPAPGATPGRYVPSTERARRELGLEAFTPLPEAIRRTLAFHRAAAGTATR